MPGISRDVSIPAPSPSLEIIENAVSLIACLDARGTSTRRRHGDFWPQPHSQYKGLAVSIVTSRISIDMNARLVMTSFEGSPVVKENVSVLQKRKSPQHGMSLITSWLIHIVRRTIANSPLQCWDNSTRGLDSATALEFVRTLRTSTELTGATAIVTLYQASQVIYDVTATVQV